MGSVDLDTILMVGKVTTIVIKAAIEIIGALR
jgi:hypothetical protein